jgi:acetyltransferase
MNELIAYPHFVLLADMAHVLTLADGSTLPVRRARDTDAAALQQFYDGLSAQSRYQRFFGFLNVLTGERARAFTQLDSADGFALIVLDPAEPTTIVAVASYGSDPGADRADFAVAVADDWQGRGVGPALIRRLTAAARCHGVRQFSAAVLPQNARMRRILDALGMAMHVRWEDGFIRIDLDLTSVEPATQA